MRYFLDTEFNSFGGALISMALVREDGKWLYVVYGPPASPDPWVAENVLPIIWSIPERNEERGDMIVTCRGDPAFGAQAIAEFLAEDAHQIPIIITDWPDDIKYFCAAIIVGPGQMVNIPRVVFDMVRVDAYPTTVEDAVQHNALWDAIALKERCINP